MSCLVSCSHTAHVESCDDVLVVFARHGLEVFAGGEELELSAPSVPSQVWPAACSLDSESRLLSGCSRQTQSAIAATAARDSASDRPSCWSSWCRSVGMRLRVRGLVVLRWEWQFVEQPTEAKEIAFGLRASVPTT